MLNPLVKIRDLSVAFPLRSKNVTAIDGLTLQIARGEIVGVIGESGAGKSTVGRALISLIDPPGFVSGGRIEFDGQEILGLDAAQRAALRGRRIGYIFQNPLTSLNPVLSIGTQMIETLRELLGLDEEKAREEAVRLLSRVEIPNPEGRLRQFPHQLSGGQRQRVVIAMAIAAKPDLLIADEPTTALDVTIQAAVLALIRKLCKEEQIGCMLVTHDMGVIAEVTDRLYVMRHGRLVETGTTRAVIGNPQAEYTRTLIRAIPPLRRRLHRLPVPALATRTESPDWQAAMAYLTRAQAAVPASEPGEPLVSVRQVSMAFGAKPTLGNRKPVAVQAVDDVSFDIMPGETLGVVGESGSGKSTIGRIIVGLQAPTLGQVLYRGKDIAAPMPAAERLRRRLEMQVIFQDPASSLDPRMLVRDSIGHALRMHALVPDRREREAIVRGLLERVGLPAEAANCYPHQFSGGQLQRIGIARALSMRPRFIFCDEPTSALDVSIQAQVLNLLRDLQDEFGLTMLFVSHDLSVVRQMADRVAVMRNGKLCEIGSNEQIFERPQNDYTRLLLDAVSSTDALLPENADGEASPAAGAAIS